MVTGQRIGSGGFCEKKVTPELPRSAGPGARKPVEYVPRNMTCCRGCHLKPNLGLVDHVKASDSKNLVISSLRLPRISDGMPYRIQPMESLVSRLLLPSLLSRLVPASPADPRFAD